MAQATTIATRGHGPALCVIGAGAVTRRRILPALAAMNYPARSVMVFDTAPTDLGALEPGCQIVQGARTRHPAEILNEIVDLGAPVIVATPPATHMHYISGLASSGLPFAVEKPIATSASDVGSVTSSIGLMNNGFALGYYVLEKALPLTYLMVRRSAYRPLLCSRSGSAIAPAGDIGRMVDRLGRLRHVDVRLLEGTAHRDVGTARLWSAHPPRLDTLVDLAVHPLQMVQLLLREHGPGFEPEIGAIALGRSIGRDAELRQATGIGSGPTYVAIRLEAGHVSVEIRVGRLLPESRVARCLRSEWDNGIVTANFDAQEVRLELASGEHLGIRTARAVDGESRPFAGYEPQLRLFEFVHRGPRLTSRIDELDSQLSALSLWGAVCARPRPRIVPYDADLDWPGDLDVQAAHR